MQRTQVQVYLVLEYISLSIIFATLHGAGADPGWQEHTEVSRRGISTTKLSNQTASERGKLRASVTLGS